MSTQRLACEGGPKAVTLPLPKGLYGIMDVGEAEIAAVTSVLRSQRIFRFLPGPPDESAQLEARYRALCGVPHALAIGCGGTGALIAALVGVGVGSGDEVIVPGYTYVATAAACLSVGAIPILAEVDDSLTLDPDDIEARITPYTKAIIPVHMRGTTADMDPIMAVARRHGLKVIEDCAQANGGAYHGRAVGSIGDAGAFSLQHYKVITAGEGGIVTAHDQQVFRRAAMKHDSAMFFWRSDEPWEQFAGENWRMCNLRAALALAQLDRMPAILARCRALKRRLRAATASLDGLTLQRLPCDAGDCGLTFIFMLRSPQAAKRFADALGAEGVPAGTIYNKLIPDRHVYCYWDYVMEKRTSDHTGWPWSAAHREIAYSRDMLPRTLDLLNRTIQISVTQHWSDALADQVAAAIRKVHAALAPTGALA